MVLLIANHSVIDYIRTIKDDSKKAIIFKDIKDAYSSVIHQKLINIMMKDKVPPYIINYYNNFLNNLNMYVKNEDNVFNMYNGLLQGQNSSQILFIIYMNSYIYDIKSLVANVFIENDENNEFMIVFVDDIIFKITSKKFLYSLFCVLNNC